MAFTINYVDPKTGATFIGAYLKITKVQVFKADQCAYVDLAIYANEAARTAGKSPVATSKHIFNDWRGAATPETPGTIYNLYSDHFGAEHTSTATNIDDILLERAYCAIQVHPDTTDTLAGATAA